MKILQVIPTISGGGAERFVVDLCNEMAGYHSVSLLTLYPPRPDDIFRKDLSNKVGSFALNKQPGLDITIAFRLLKAIKRIKPDIIHNHLRSINYLLPILPFLGKIPIIHTIHNDALRECPNPHLRKVRRYFFESGAITPVTISKESNNSFKKAYKQTNAVLIPNGRSFPAPSSQIQQVEKEVRRYKKNNNTRVFLHIGRMEPQKNQLMLAEAFRRLHDEDDADAILLFIGGNRNTIESLNIYTALTTIERSKIGIYILGEKHNATDYLYAADFFCLSSIFEGMPISLIEAFATGTIPICTPVGGIPEMITNLELKLLSKSTSVDDYYQALKNAYTLTPTRMDVLKSEGQLLFKEKYSIEPCVQGYFNLYQDLINKIKK